MVFERELISLILYALQQLGIVLAVGSQTIVLYAYLLAMRDRIIDSQEAQFARAVRTVLVAGLGLIILSGIGITALHFLSGEYAILFSPAYLLKWILVVMVGLFTLGIGKGMLPQWIGEAFAGGTWYALFLLHILAPLTTWENLLLLYGGWLIAFGLCWSVLVFATRERTSVAAPAKKDAFAAKISPSTTPESPPSRSAIPNIPSVKVQPSPAPPLPPLQPKPSAPLEVVLTPPKILSAAPAPVLSTPPQPQVGESAAHSNLPAIRVMPRGPQELK